MNLIGTKTLFLKEVRRFLRVPGQTVMQPIVNATLYLAVFALTTKGRTGELAGVSSVQFIVPGLVFLGVANGAYLNASTSLFIAKLHGTLVDLLVAPLRPAELLIAFIGGAMVRGLFVGAITWLVALTFIGTHALHFGTTLLFLLLCAYLFAVLGVLAGMWAERMEQVNFVPAFVMTPLIFLGGVFYSARHLPEPFQTVSLLNPIVYMVEGVRAGMLGLDASPAGLGLLIGLSVGSTVGAWQLLRVGYRLKS